MTMYDSIRKQMKVLEKYNFIVQALQNIDIKHSMYVKSRSVLRYINCEFNYYKHNEILEEIKFIEEATYVYEAFTLNDFKEYLKILYGEKYPEYFI